MAAPIPPAAPVMSATRESKLRSGYHFDLRLAVQPAHHLLQLFVAAALGIERDALAAQTIDDAASAAIWNSVRDVVPFAASGALGAWPVWRIVCPPACGGALGDQLARETGGEVIYDWGGGLIWAALPQKADAQAALVRERAGAVGGHAMLVRASDEVRRNVDVFHPQPAGVASLSERVRQGFDPKNILNRGRMLRGSAT